MRQSQQRSERAQRTRLQPARSERVQRLSVAKSASEHEERALCELIRDEVHHGHERSDNSSSPRRTARARQRELGARASRWACAQARTEPTSRLPLELVVGLDRGRRRAPAAAAAAAAALAAAPAHAAVPGQPRTPRQPMLRGVSFCCLDNVRYQAAARAPGRCGRSARAAGAQNRRAASACAGGLAARGAAAYKPAATARAGQPLAGGFGAGGTAPATQRAWRAAVGVLQGVAYRCLWRSSKTACRGCGPLPGMR